MAWSASLPCSMSWSSNRVLGPADPSSTAWDKKKFGGPVVIQQNPLSSDHNAWNMYYYGRDTDMWNMGIPPFNPILPTGRIGVATSTDGGFSFARSDHGVILDPSDDVSAFDCVHIGVGDVVFDQISKKWLLYYFGGSFDELPLAGLPGVARGVRLQTGVAVSTDGIRFERASKGPILGVGEKGSWDENAISWPRILMPNPQPKPDTNMKPYDDKWIMSYHARESGGFFSIGLATSHDGMSWVKQGKVLSRGKPGAWDEGGASVRYIIRYNGQYLMFYEGSNFKFDFAIGLAKSNDGIVWTRDDQCGPEPGGPILKPRKGEYVWDNYVVGTPYVVVMPDHSLRMYYLGLSKNEDNVIGDTGIGIADSNGSDFWTWSRLPLE